MMRKVAGILMLGCASMALAQQNITRESVRGLGVAKNAENKAVHFSLIANRATSGDHTFVSGNLELTTLQHDSRHGVSVVLPLVKHLTIVAHHAELSGPGFLAVVEDHTIHRIPGTVVAAVADLGVPTHETDPMDTIHVHFTPENPVGTTFDFAGDVTQGDIAIHAAQ